VLCVVDELVDVGRRLDIPQCRQPCGSRGADGVRLVAGQLEDLGGRSDERDTGGEAGVRERRVLAEEAVAGIDGIGAGVECGVDHGGGFEIGTHRVPGLTDLVRLVGLEPVLRAAIFVRIDRDRLGPEFTSRTECPDRDLSPVGHQNLVEHECTPFPGSARGDVHSRSAPASTDRSRCVRHCPLTMTPAELRLEL